MKRITAYTILKGLGNKKLFRYIHQEIAKNEFDSHDVTNPFPSYFKDEYDAMLKAHEDEGDNSSRNIKISNAIGRYLGYNRRSLRIEKIGSAESPNMNGAKSRTSLWRKYE